MNCALRQFLPCPLRPPRGVHGALPPKGSPFFPGMAVTASRIVAGLEEQDGIGIAQSDTQQVSSGEGKKQDQG